MSTKTLTPKQRQALLDAAKRGYIFSHVPGSRYSGFWEPGKHHFRVVDNLLERGYLEYDERHLPRITDKGREAAERIAA